MSSSSAMAPKKQVPVPVPRTAVPLGISDPVESARAELKAALMAIEVKANVPKRLTTATDDGVRKARVFARRQPAAAIAAVVSIAAAVGTAVWAAVRAYAR
ncbi:hypothetical protein ACPW96_12345 [Micromonospora sp. DT81.3]|uniref:hypothetical protein n=1 Tax=Actinomycetes TaxID=1760 RepID=UPI003CF38B45